MPNDIIYLNGKHPLINDEKLKESFFSFLGRTVSNSILYIFSNFPAPVSAEYKIDILAILSIEDFHGNYLRVSNNYSSNNYFRNFILPISINNNHFEDTIEVVKNNLLINGIFYENNDELLTIKFGLKNLLESKCFFEKGKVQLIPIEILINKNKQIVFEQTFVDYTINWQNIFSYVKLNPNLYFQSYSPWKGNLGFQQFKLDIAKLNTVASLYTEYGYLTKRKIDRIGKQLSKNLVMFESVGKEPTIIVGKAGTGKTSHLLNILLSSLSKRNNVTFLTYNHLLVKDVAYQVKMTQDFLYSSLNETRDENTNLPSGIVQTLMKFTFGLSKKLGVLHLMSETRMIELKLIMENSCLFLEKNLPILFEANSNRLFQNFVNWNAAVEVIQNTNWSIESKQYGIQFVNFLKKNNKSLTINLNESIIEFRKAKIINLENLTQKNVFLNDYSGCLENTLKAIRNTEAFYSQFNVESKYDLLEILMNLKNRVQDNHLLEKKISLELYTNRVKNVIKGRASKSRILIIDEGQDCHNYEREIFYEMFDPKNIVISHGGKEQLIRFSNTCDWGYFKGKRIQTKKIPSGNKSYRIKQNILDFCNFIAEKYRIDLNLKSFSEEDPGQIIFDFRQINTQTIKTSFSSLIEKGNVNGCSNLESLLIMDVNKSTFEIGNNNHNTKHEFETIVNEFNVMEERTITKHNNFPYLTELNSLTEYWLGAVDDKNKLSFPSPNEVRIINYESCRGLEAWCVMCLNFDKFFLSQSESKDAENYLLNEDMYLTKEQRSAMYAITWVLMAATRAIDTLYIQVSGTSSDFSKLCLEYTKINPDKCICT